MAEEEEEEEKRRRMMMEEMSKIIGKMSKDMRKLSKISEEMSKDMGKMSEIMGEMSKITTTTTGEMSSTTTTTFPQHIIMEILSWIPAKSLVSSFKFVCKEWRALMLDPHFVKMHINRRGGGGRGLICKSGNVLFQLHPPFNFEGGIPTLAATKLVDGYFGRLLSSGFRLVGSCNGLICLSINHDQNIILLNPSTRKFKISPIQPIEHPSEYVKFGVTYGFGCCYNSTNKVDEYKVVRIVGLGYAVEYHSILAQSDVYSMRSDSWRRELDIGDSYDISFDQTGVFSNGALHWIGWNVIASFDIRNEEFRQVQIPSFKPTAESFESSDDDSDDDPYSQMPDIILMNMRGCLAMIRSSDVNNTMDVDLEVWVMKEYGKKKSWTKEFVIRSSDSDPPRALSEFSMSSSSTACVLKGDQILIDGSPSEEGYRKLVLYDINEGKIDGNFKIIGVPDKPNMFQFDYIETLVSLKSLLLPLSNN